MNAPLCLRDLSDDDLLARTRALVARERGLGAEVVAHLGEVEARNLHLGLGYSSLHVYCCQALGYAEGAAFKRVYAARAARRFPIILEHLRSGALSLAVVAVLAPKLDDDSAAELIEAARHKSRRQVEALLASRFPAAPVPDRIRPLIGEAPAAQLSLQQSPGTAGGSEPDSAARYRIELTGDQALLDKLQQAKDLLRHAVPDGNLAQVLDRALTVFLAQATRRKAAVTARPRQTEPPVPVPVPGQPKSRHLPAAVRRAVWLRDGGQCAFVGPDGHRCGERGFLELHHIVPFAAGGPNTVANIALRCAAHNRHEAVRDFGRATIERARRRAEAPPPDTRLALVETALRNLGCSAGEARAVVTRARTMVPETDAVDNAALEALLRASLKLLPSPARRC